MPSTPLAVSRLKTAIAKAEEMGFLGDHIMGTDFSFHLHVNRGAGAFVCGEGLRPHRLHRGQPGHAPA